MYAIIRDRGMQYRVEEGQVVEVALMDAEPGSQVELDEVLLIGGTERMLVGAPLVAGVKVLARVLGAPSNAPVPDARVAAQAKPWRPAKTAAR